MGKCVPHTCCTPAAFHWTLFNLLLRKNAYAQPLEIPRGRHEVMHATVVVEADLTASPRPLRATPHLEKWSQRNHTARDWSNPAG